MDAKIIEIIHLKRGKQEVTPYEPASKAYFDNAGANIKYFKIDELKKLINSTSSPFYKMIYLLLFETAARISEARLVKFSDIDLNTNKIRIVTLKQRHNRNIYRVLKISDTLKAATLQHRLANNLSENDFIFTKNTTSKPVSKQAIDKNLKKDVGTIFGKSMLDKAHPHIFRHTRAINLLDSGMNIVKLKDFLGHSNIQNTLIYLRYSNTDVLRSIDDANKMNGLI